MKLRDYQTDILSKVKKSVLSGENPLVQLDTGAGKTPIIAALCAQFENTIVLTHRNELAVQASDKLAAFGIEHDFVGTKSTRQRASFRHHVNGHGRGLIVGSKNCIVASVQSLISWDNAKKFHVNQDKNWVVLIDEAHHALAENMWGDVGRILKNRQFVGFTGTPARLDGEPLHQEKGGLFSCLIQAESLKKNSTRTLMERGFLADYIAFSPADPSQFTFDYEKKQVAGSVVGAYKKHADGTKAICLCVSIKAAKILAKEFSSAGIPSMSISSDMGQSSINRVLDFFADGRIKVMCAVDMVSEGFDCPDAETLICTNFTKSFVRYRQWVGRVLRPSDGKVARIIDMCGLIYEHGMPDDDVVWDILNPPVRSQKLQHIPCTCCKQFFKASASACPHCGAENEVFNRGSGKVSRYLIERLDLSLIEQERQAISLELQKKELEERIVMPYFGAEYGAIGSAVAKIRLKFVAALEDLGITFSEINKFLRSQECKDHDFWVNRFTIAHLNQHEKFRMKSLKEFQKWASK